MTRVVSAPYLTAPTAAFPCRWLLETPQGHVNLPPLLEHWDYSTALSIAVELTVTMPDLRRHCGVSTDDTLATSIVWHASGTNLRGACHIGPCPPDAPILTTLGGALLGGTLNLETQVVLIEAAAGPRAPLAAHRPGSVLWRCQASVALEGNAPRFPTESLDFSRSELGSSRAAWYLQWNRDDLYAAGLGVMRLYVNRSHPLMAHLADAPDATVGARLALDALRYDLVRAVLTGCLANPDFVDGVDFGPGSVGQIAATMANIHFPNDSIASLRTLLREDPQKFETRVQHAVRLWAEDP